jgi:6-phosphogluconolactonase
MIEEIPCVSLADAARRAARALADAVCAGLARRGVGALAVSGGRTPRRVLPLLAKEPLAWDKVVVTLTDERWVALDHADSNEAQTRSLLLVGPAARARFIGLKTAAAAPEAGRAECEARLGQIPWPLDAVFLGMGDDGHVASLFADDPAWRAAPGRCVGVPATSGRGARLSLTPAALLDSRRIVLVVAGMAKADAYRRARRPGPTAALPIRCILHQEQAPVTVFRVSD